MLVWDAAQATFFSLVPHIPCWGLGTWLETWLKLKAFSKAPHLSGKTHQCPETFPVTRAFQYLPDLEVPSVPKSWDQKSTGGPGLRKLIF